MFGFPHDTTQTIEIIDSLPKMTKIEPNLFKSTETIKFVIYFDRVINLNYVSSVIMNDVDDLDYTLTFALNDPKSLTATANILRGGKEGFYNVKVNFCNKQIDFPTQIIIVKDPPESTAFTVFCSAGFILNVRTNTCISCKELNKKFLNGSCVDACPYSSFIYGGYICTDSCQSFGMFAYERNCVNSCPIDWVPGENGVCTNCKLNGQFYLNNQCVKTCPDGYISVSSTNVCTYNINLFQAATSKTLNI
jgi:hypothetical protein